MNVPLILRVLLSSSVPSSIVVPLHCITDPFSPAVALNVRVEVISPNIPSSTVLVIFVKVATKSMLSHCGVVHCRSIVVPMGVVITNWILPLLAGRNGSTIHSS